MFPSLPTHNPVDVDFANWVIPGDGRQGFSLGPLTDASDIGGLEFGPMVGFSTGAGQPEAVGMGRIFAGRAVLQVLQAVIRFVTIPMIHFKVARPNEGFKNQSVDAAITRRPSGTDNADPFVPLGSQGAAGHTPRSEAQSSVCTRVNPGELGHLSPLCLHSYSVQSTFSVSQTYKAGLNQ